VTIELRRKAPTLSCRFTLERDDFIAGAYWQAQYGAFRIWNRGMQWAWTLVFGFIGVFLVEILLMPLLQWMIPLQGLGIRTLQGILSVLASIAMARWAYRAYARTRAQKDGRFLSRSFIERKLKEGETQLAVNSLGVSIRNEFASFDIRAGDIRRLVETETHLLILFGAWELGMIPVSKLRLIDCTPDDIKAAIRATARG
jgi:hypothetical protein